MGDRAPQAARPKAKAQSSESLVECRARVFETKSHFRLLQEVVRKEKEGEGGPGEKSGPLHLGQRFLKFVSLIAASASYGN